MPCGDDVIENVALVARDRRGHVDRVNVMLSHVRNVRANTGANLINPNADCLLRWCPSRSDDR
jgi:hypothetical protein